MVSRPFRLAPPYPPGGSVARPRLIERLQHRWDRRLVTVVAGAGFGKTVLLSAVVGAKGALSAGRDVWLCCEPADEYSEHLIEGLLAAVGLAPGAGLDAVLEWVWTQAPTPVCFVFDDVHEVPANSPGAAVLSRLVTDLPRNGHVVMSSRDRVPVSAARLAAAAQLERITEAELVLEPSELRAFGASRGIDPAVLESTGGWPALAELTASAGSDLLFDYLWEEILGRVGFDRDGG